MAPTLQSIDLNDGKIFTLWKRVVERIGLSNDLAEFQDARRLPYSDASLDFVHSVSVIEHIPGSGDSEAFDR